MEKYFEILKKCPLFENIEEENLGAMLHCLGAKPVTYARQETVLAEGEPARRMGILLSGSLQILQTDYFGNRSIVATVEPGELFGETFACANVETLPVSVVAVKDSEALLLEHARVTHTCCNACAFHQQIIYNLLKVVATKNLLFHQKIAVTSRRTTRDKLWAYLLFQAKKQGSARFAIPFDRQELADYLEVDRSGLSAEIGKLCREGLLKANRREFELLQWPNA